MGPPSRFKTFFSYIYVAVYSPLLVSHFFLDIILYALPWARPAREWSRRQASRVRLVKLILYYWSVTRSGDRLTLRPGRERNRFEVVYPKSPKLYKGVLSDAHIAPGPLGMTWTPSRPPPAVLVKPGMTVVLHFHGGGFVLGNGRDKDTGFLASTLLRNMGCTYVCTPQYRLAEGMDGRFPAPVQDALTAYLCLLREKGIPASQIILSGDSAGGNIALGLLRYIMEHGQEDDIPAPGAVALWSPWVDVSSALDTDMKAVPNYGTDYVNLHFGRWGANAISGYGAVDLTSPYLSPKLHPFSLNDSIPMFIHAGAREVLYDDIADFSRRYKELGWKTHLVTAYGCPHDVLLLGHKMGFVEAAQEAAREARKFLCETCGMKLRPSS